MFQKNIITDMVNNIASCQIGLDVISSAIKNNELSNLFSAGCGFCFQSFDDSQSSVWI